MTFDRELEYLLMLEPETAMAMIFGLMFAVGVASVPMIVCGGWE